MLQKLLLLLFLPTSIFAQTNSVEVNYSLKIDYD